MKYESERRWNEEHPNYHRNYFNEKRIKVLLLLGNKCICCGVTEWWNLQLDHIKPQTNNRMQSVTVYTKILKGELNKEDFQILCRGCNISKGTTNTCRLNH